METGAREAARFDSPGVSPHGIRWTAVLAGLAAGLGAQLLLLIGIGACIAFQGVCADDSSLWVAAAAWSMIGIFIAALVSAYAATRSFSLRRGALRTAIRGRAAPRTTSPANAWLGAMILLSLLTGAGGALFGARKRGDVCATRTPARTAKH